MRKILFYIQITATIIPIVFTIILLLLTGYSYHEHIQDYNRMHDDIKAGYDIYLDGTKLDNKNAINVDSNNYDFSIDDDKRIVYFEKKVDDSTGVMPMPIPIMH